MNAFRKYAIILVFVLTNVVYASLGFYFSLVVCSVLSLVGLLSVNSIHQAGGRVPFPLVAGYWYVVLVFPVFQYAQLTESVIIFGSYLVSLGILFGVFSGFRSTFEEWKEETMLRLIAVSEFVKRTHTRAYSRPTETLRGDTDMATWSDVQRWIQELYDAGIDGSTLHEMFWGMHDWDTVIAWTNGSAIGIPKEAVEILCDLHRYFCDLEEFDINEGLVEIAPAEAIDRRQQQLIDIAHSELTSENEVAPDYVVESASESN